MLRNIRFISRPAIWSLEPICCRSIHDDDGSLMLLISFDGWHMAPVAPHAPARSQPALVVVASSLPAICRRPQQ